MQTLPFPGGAASMQPVIRIEDLEFLVKESEVLTGHGGRRFVIAGAERLHYLVHWRSPALVIERIDPKGQVLDRRYLLPWEFEEHPLALAMTAQQLFVLALKTDA